MAFCGGPANYECDALPAELSRHTKEQTTFCNAECLRMQVFLQLIITQYRFAFMSEHSFLFLSMAIGVIAMLVNTWRHTAPANLHKAFRLTYLGYFIVILSLLGLSFYSSRHVIGENTLIAITPEMVNAFGNVLWPLIAFFAVLYLTPNLLDLLNRGATIDTPLGRISGANRHQESVSPNTTNETASAPDTSNLNELQTYIYHDLERGINEYTPEVKLQKLLSAFSVAIYRERFERLYNIIFGTQLQILFSLQQNLQPDLQAVYETYKTRWSTHHPVPPATYDEWLGFMVNSGLINTTGELRLQPYGSEFLRFITARGYPLDKKND